MTISPRLPTYAPRTFDPPEAWCGAPTILRERYGIALVEHPIHPEYAAVVRIDWHRCQVYSIVPADLPAGGGLWCARISRRGVDYVARWRRLPTSRRYWRRCVAARREEEA